MNIQCINFALQVLGDKWSPLLLKELAERQTARFSDLEKGLEGISARTLTQRLQMLEETGILLKEQYCDRPPRFTYRLTSKGADLVKVLVEMGEWSEKYKPADC
jgi:DNA-binding HxlR family transcriptional regulator